MTNEDDADIVVYGQTESAFYSTNESNKNGITNTHEDLIHGTYYASYDNVQKSILILSKAEVFIPNKNRTEAAMRATVKHELGHALGFLGHSESGSDLMYKSSSAQNITLNDVQHLSQVYKLIYADREKNE